MSEFIHLDATAQAHAIANGDISPTEAVDAAITQAQKVNPQLNAIIHEQFDTARAQAKGSLPDGPFRGVPMVLKDLGAAQAGEKYHMGSRMLKNVDFRAPFDSYLTERFRRAGFVVIGRTNTNRDVTDAECVARRNFHNVHHRRFVQVVVVIHAIAHIERQHFHHLRNNEVESHRAVDRDRCRFGRHDPTGGDHIVEICEVIAMEVRHENGR